jgi:hypothetical protein
MQPRQCAGCGAPLPSTDVDGVIACRFCGLAHDAQPHLQVARVVIRGASDATRSAAKVASVVAALAAVVIGVVGLAIGVAVWRASRRPALVTVPTTATPATGTGVIRIADLPALAPGRHALEAAPLPAGYGAVDAVAALPWALTIAQGWAPDAAISRIDVERLRPDGTVNAVDDADALVRYRFVSPARASDLRERARTSARAEAVTELHLTLAQGAPMVQGIRRSASSGGDAIRPPHPDVLTVPALITRLPAESYRHPFLKGYLLHLSGEGWVWYFGTLAGESLPRVRAVDGATWPYRDGRARAPRNRG